MVRYNWYKKVLFIMKSDSVVMEDGNILFDNMSHLSKFRDEQTFCDVILRVRKLNQQNAFDELYAHSCVLAAVSDFFHEVLRKNEIYKQSSKHICIENIECEILKLCVDFMYGLSLTVRHCDLVKLKQAAELFKIGCLVKHCALCMEILEKQQQSEQNKPNNDTNEADIKRSIESVDIKNLQDEHSHIQASPHFSDTFETSDEKSLEKSTHIHDKIRCNFQTNEQTVKVVESNVCNSDAVETSLHDDDLFAANIPANDDTIETTSMHDSDTTECRIMQDKNIIKASQDIESAVEETILDRQEEITLLSLTDSLLKPKALQKDVHGDQKNNQDVLQFVCDFCGKSLKTQKSLKIHLRYQHEIGCENLKIHKCPHCTYTNRNYDLLKRHMEVHEENRQRDKCDICGKYYFYRYLDRHIQEVHKVGVSQERLERMRDQRRRLNQKMKEKHKQPQTCHHCGVTFQNYCKMRTHLKVVKGKAFLCQYCSRTFHSKRTLEIHERKCKNKLLNLDGDETCDKFDVPKKHIQKKIPDLVKTATSKNLRKSPRNEDGSLVCDICGIYYDRKSLLKKHMLVKHKIGYENAKIHKCPHCPYENLILQNLKSHMISHQENRDYKCEKCGKSFFRKSMLKRHIMSVHEKVQPPPEVMHKLRVKRKILNQAMYEKNKQAQICKHCGVTFRNYRALRVHLRGLEGKLFPCKYCSTVCPSPAALRLHIKRHKGEKNFQCEKCDYRAVTQMEIKLHQSAHNNVGSTIVCEVCGKGYKMAKNLQIHRRVEHGFGCQDFIKCPQCSFSHPHPSQVRNHMIAHHNHRDKVCTVCGKAYKRGHSLNKHMKEAHNGYVPVRQKKLTLCPIREDSDVELPETNTQTENESSAIESNLHHQPQFLTITQRNEHLVNDNMQQGTDLLSTQDVLVSTSPSKLVTQCVEYGNTLPDDDNLIYI